MPAWPWSKVKITESGVNGQSSVSTTVKQTLTFIHYFYCVQENRHQVFTLASPLDSGTMMWGGKFRSWNSMEKRIAKERSASRPYTGDNAKWSQGFQKPHDQWTWKQLITEIYPWLHDQQKCLSINSGSCIPSSLLFNTTRHVISPPPTFSNSSRTHNATTSALQVGNHRSNT